jgi:nucleoside-diphosphate-sugar epimerase
MRIFVTGGTGFIGSHFINTAHVAGHEVVALRRPGSTSPIPLTSEPKWIEGSLADDHRDSLIECDALVHLAAAGVSPQKSSWQEMFQINVADSIKLLHAAYDTGIVHHIICGSCFEYGQSASRYDFIPVDAPLEPNTGYGASKAAASIGALAMARNCIPNLTILRPFHIFGLGQHHENFWPSLRNAALSGRDFSMTSGEQIRDFTPVDDVAKEFVSELQSSKSEMPNIRNLGTGKPQTLAEFARHWWKYWNASGNLLIGKESYRPNEVMRYVPEL